MFGRLRKSNSPAPTPAPVDQDMLHRQGSALCLRADTFDQNASTVDVIAAAGATVERHDWTRGETYDEELVVDADSVMVDVRQVPLLDGHNTRTIGAQIGHVQSWRVENGQLIATVRLYCGTDGGRAVIAMLEGGGSPAASVGYNPIEKIREERDGQRPLVRVTKWDWRELSFVPIAADKAAGVRSTNAPLEMSDPVLARADKAGPQELISLERQRTSDILDAVGTTSSLIGLQDRSPLIETARRAIAAGTSVEAARRQLWDQMAMLNETSYAQIAGASSGETRDNPKFDTELMAEGLLSRFVPSLCREGNPYAGVTPGQLAEQFCQRFGIIPQSRDRAGFVDAAMKTRGGLHGTSDFPAILGNAQNKFLRESFRLRETPLKMAGRQRLVQDFKPVRRPILGEGSDLEKVIEGAEVKYGTIGESEELYTVATFARKYALTRQAMINDDLDAFSRMPVMFADRAAALEAKIIVALLAQNTGSGPTMASGTALFDVAHGNVPDTDGVLAIGTLGAGRAAMRQQRGIDGQDPLNIAPRYLVVPSALETAADQLVTSITPEKTADVNPFAGNLETLVEARLDDVSATAWYLAADPQMYDGLEYGYLEGAQGPQISSQEDFDTMGLKFRVSLDFGAGFVDHRSWFRNAGSSGA